jgi:hypothetical protein
MKSWNSGVAESRLASMMRYPAPPVLVPARPVLVPALGALADGDHDGF